MLIADGWGTSQSHAIISNFVGKDSAYPCFALRLKCAGLYLSKIIIQQSFQDHFLHVPSQSTSIMIHVFLLIKNTSYSNIFSKKMCRFCKKKRLELCSGGELFDRIVADGKFTEQVAAYCVQQMLRAVNYMHINGIMHRLKLRKIGNFGKVGIWIFLGKKTFFRRGFFFGRKKIEVGQ